MEKLIILLVLSSIISLPSLAARQTNKFYVEAGVGITQLGYNTLSFISLAEQDKADAVELKKAKSVIIMGEVGYKITPRSRIGFTLTHYFEAESFMYSDKKNPETLTKSASLQQRSSNGFVTIYSDIYNIDAFNIFLHTGLGLNYMKYKFSTYNYKNEKEEGADNHLYSIGTRLGVGASYALNTTMELQVKYTYSLLNAKPIPLKKIETLEEEEKVVFDFSNNEHNITFSFRFSL